eukprot:scaffold7506_cov286-Pinguiococcus_pyrenoidosus.AAC.14
MSRSSVQGPQERPGFAFTKAISNQLNGGRTAPASLAKLPAFPKQTAGKDRDLPDPATLLRDPSVAGSKGNLRST